MLVSIRFLSTDEAQMHAPSRKQGIGDSARSGVRTAAFVLRLMPMLPSGWLDRFSPEPVYEQIVIPGPDASPPAEMFRPADRRSHAGVVVCLGVIPFDVTHPQVQRLGRALARRGFAVLIVWSEEMRSLRISPDDTGSLVAAYNWLLEQQYVDAGRSGLLGTCVGAGFALQAAARPEIRDRVRFVTCFAPFGSLRSLALDIGSETTEIDGIRRPWQVDQLSRRVYVRTLTANLEPDEAERLETSWFERRPLPTAKELSRAGQEVLRVLQTTDRAELERLLDRLPALKRQVDAVSPIDIAGEIRANHVSIGHDRDDTVLPFGESQRLYAAMGRRPGVVLTEFHMFQHADPTKRKLGKWRLVVELWKFARFCSPALRFADDAKSSRMSRSG